MKEKFTYMFFFLTSLVYCQGENSNWYFINNAGLNFEFCFNNVNPLLNGRVEKDPIGPDRQSSAISDKEGNLLFYTDCHTIWNRNHEPFPNANISNGTELKGFSNVIILPKPGIDSLYYIFVIDLIGLNNSADDGINSGLNYSLINMNLDGGMGDIVTSEKDIELVTFNPNDNNQPSIKVGKKLTAVRGSDCNSYWIITHFRSNFYAFKLDENGVNPNPVVSSLPPLIEIIENPNFLWYHGHGQMKASPDGTKIALAHTFLDNEFINNGPGGIYLYDFDNSTGVLNNTKQVFLGQGLNDNPHSIEFSPLSRYLYATTLDIADEDGTTPGKFLRWDLNAPDIPITKTEIDPGDFNQGSDLQLGPDNNIYKTLSNNLSDENNESIRYLGVINDPDATSIVNINYQRLDQLIDSSGNFENTTGGTLPQINNQWFNKRINIVQNGISWCELFLCGNENETLTAEEIIGADYQWYKDGLLISNESNFQLEVSEPGFYEVSIEPNDGRCPIDGNATVMFSNEIPTALDAGILQCDEGGLNDGVTIFNLSEITEVITNNEPNLNVKYYENVSNAQNETSSLNELNYINTSNPQKIYAVVTSLISGCNSISEIELRVSSTSSNDAELNGCDDDGTLDGYGSFVLSNANSEILEGLPPELSVTYFESYSDALLENNSLSINYANTSPYNQIIYARVEDNFNCYGISEILLTLFETPAMEVDSESIYCLNSFPEALTLTAGLLNDNPSNFYYDWSTGENTSQIEVNAPGIYTVRVTNVEGCFKDRTITVLASNIATITNINVIDASENNTVTIIVSGEGDYEFALDNIDGPYQDNNSFENVRPGLYTVYVRDKNDCGVVEDLVSVIGFPKYFTPNNDGTNDYWQVKGISSQFQANTIIYIFDRYGKLLKELDPLGSGWDGTYNGSPMPTSDYWFSVTLEDGRQFASHFTLKR